MPFFALVVGYAFAQLGRFKETSRSWLPFFVFKHFHFVCNLFELYLNFSLFGVVIGFLFFFAASEADQLALAAAQCQALNYLCFRAN